MADLLNDDLLLVQRGGASYKFTGEDLKVSVRPKPIDPVPGDVTATPNFVSGTGTQGDPYIISPSTIPAAGQTEFSSQELLVVSGIEGDIVSFEDLSVGADSRFAQPDDVIDSAGQWTGRLRYIDTPSSSSTTVYTGDLKLGSVYFRWVVTQEVLPPLVGDTASTIAGTPTQGQTLILTPGTATGGVGTISYSYRWELSATGTTDWSAIAGATGTSYLLDAADANKYIRAVTIATDQATPTPQTLELPSNVLGPIAATTPPLIGSVVLTEDDATGAAFTSQSFTTTITMADPGLPVADRRLKSWVEGELSSQLISTNAITAKSDVTLGFTTQAWVTTTGNVRACAWDGTQFLAGGGESGVEVLATSPDGVNWTRISLPVGNSIGRVNTIAYGNGIHVVGGGGTEVAVSTDGGANWTMHVVEATTTNMTGMLYYNGEFWAIGARGGAGSIWSSPDGVNWTRKHNQSSTTYNDIAVDGKGTFVGVANSSKVSVSTDGGVTWSDQTLSFPGGTNAIDGVAYGNGLFVGVGSDRQEIATSADGVTWTTTTTGLPDIGQGSCCDYVGGLFYVGGSDGRLQTSVDGVTWVDESGVFNQPTTPIRSICGNSTTLLLASDDGPFVSTSAIPSTTLTIAGAQTDGFLVDDAIHSVPAAANGVIISLTDSQVVASPSTAWAIGQQIQGEPKTQPGTRLYLAFNAVGAISDMQTADPGYVQTTNQDNPKLTFPATFPSGNAPDEELPPGTTLTVEVEASNVAGTNTRTSNVVTPPRIFAIGEAVAGGYFAGQINDGGTVYNLIVAPLVEGNLQGQYNGTIQWSTTGTSDAPEALNETYGGVTTTTFANPQHPLFDWCVNSATGPNGGNGIGGFTDWYIPAKNELEILYRYLKPSAFLNDDGYGANPDAVPPTENYTEEDPAQTTVTDFQDGNTEAFEVNEFYWSATEYSPTEAWTHYFINGTQLPDYNKDSNYYAREIRRVPAA